MLSFFWRFCSSPSRHDLAKIWESFVKHDQWEVPEHEGDPMFDDPITWAGPLYESKDMEASKRLAIRLGELVGTEGLREALMSSSLKSTERKIGVGGYRGYSSVGTEISVRYDYPDPEALQCHIYKAWGEARR